MDWIERLLHVSPDGGSGTLELGIIAGAAVAVAMVTVSVVGLLPMVTRWLRARRAPAGEALQRPLERFQD